MDRNKKIQELGIILIGMLLASVAVYFFLVPSKTVVGSISGLAMVLSQLSGIALSTVTLLLNVVLLLAGFLLLGKDFGAKTVFTSLLLPFFLWVFESICPITESLTGNLVIDVLSYILIVALGQALLFHVNASSGGLDIVAKILNKFTHMDIGKAVTASGVVTAMTSILVYDLPTLIVSLLGTYANGLAVDYFVDGLKKKKRVCILADDYEEIKRYIHDELQEGITLYLAKGVHVGKEQIELITILPQHKYKLLLNYLHNSEQHMFVTVSTVNEVICRPVFQY